VKSAVSLSFWQLSIAASHMAPVRSNLDRRYIDPLDLAALTDPVVQHVATS